MKVSAVKNYNYSNSFCFRNNLEKTNNNQYKNEYLNHFDYKKTAAYSASIIAAGIGVIYLAKNMKISSYAKTLSNSLNTITGKKIPAENLSCVMSGDELLKILPKLTKKNYEANSQNIKNGFFIADLHSHSNYSDGEGFVKNLLEDAAEYADILYKKTKQKFIFALTDHDTTEGVKEALEIIASNPKRYKNLRFVPAIEVSFSHKTPKSNNPCEISELLVYGINPYSRKLNHFLNNTKQKRTQMVNNFINEASKKCPLTEFSFNEFSRFYDFEKYGNMMNLHWRINHYVQTKHAVTNYAARINENPNILYEKIMQNNKGVSLGQLHEYGKIPYDIQENHELHSILKKYEPHIENQKIITTSENSFEDVIEGFKNEKNIFMAFAHPAYLTERVNDPYEELKYFTELSNGLIKASESFHQAYPSRITEENIRYFQDKTESLNLLNLGGRDNHKNKLFN